MACIKNKEARSGEIPERALRTLSLLEKSKPPRDAPTTRNEDPLLTDMENLADPRLERNPNVGVWFGSVALMYQHESPTVRQERLGLKLKTSVAVLSALHWNTLENRVLRHRDDYFGRRPLGHPLGFLLGQRPSASGRPEANHRNYVHCHLDSSMENTSKRNVHLNPTYVNEWKRAPRV